MINSVALSGRLTADPELRYTGSGIAVVQFTLAVDRSFTNAQGEKEADFVRIVAWRKQAEMISNNVRKGALVGIEGRIQTRNYDDNDGKRVYITEVVSENFTFLESKSNNQGNQGQQSNGQNNYQNKNNYQNNYQNQNQNDYQNNQYQNNNDSIDISDDDLPFD